MSALLTMLLASIGPLLVGFVNLDDDPAADDEDDALPEETAEDPIEIIDVETFIQNARSLEDNEGDVRTSRGTDADAAFVAEADRAVSHDASGGNDTLTGSALNDTLAGGNGADVIEGGNGDDALFGAFERATRPDDDASDTLIGGAGDDTLFLGDGDTGTGGEGRDVFVTTQDAQDATTPVTVTDFNASEDAIAVETAAPDTASITEQVVEDGGLRIELSTGLSLRLEGVDAPVDAGAVQFVPVPALLES
ncbi:hypothetical protein ABMC88_05795 [Sulfitobacter sp. HNIBRBA2951]|uniref:hypothetical protein n=1 Tax=Sulfitobacter aquimarinus TaxID=3158557 RepID=UPI0032E018BC